MFNTLDDWAKAKPPARAVFLSDEYKNWDDIFNALELGDIDYDAAAKITHAKVSTVMKLYERYRARLMGEDK